VVLAGDDDQAIYEWSGADVPRLINQQGTVTVLGQSYRVPSNIQNLANSIIVRCRNRRDKKWNPREGTGGIHNHRILSDVDLRNSNDILILARNTFLIKEQIEPYLRQNGIFYEKNGFSSVKDSTLQAIKSWEALRSGQQISVAQATLMYDQMSTGIGIKRGYKKLPTFDPNETVDMNQLTISGGLLVGSEKIWHEALDRIPQTDRSYIVAARRRGEKLNSQPRVRISTIHSAKGAEAEHVILMKEMARKTFQEMEKFPDQENRVFYVGVTRAKQRLSIIDSPNNRIYPWI
jgi:DNA helicase-2/ATP-dependent DNA helicase PcrA